ncbi:hypothetical protein Nmel_018904 [Mimus melanotis]
MCPHGSVADQCPKSAYPHSMSPMSVCPRIPLSPYPSCSQVSVSSIPCVLCPLVHPSPIPYVPHVPTAFTTPCALCPHIHVSHVRPYPHIQPSHCPFFSQSSCPFIQYPFCPVSPYPCVTLSLVSICPCAAPSLFPHDPAVPYLCVPSVRHTGVPRSPVVPTRVPAFVALSPEGSAGDTDPPAPLQYRRGASSTGGAMEPASRSGCGIAALWPLGNEPGQGEGSPRTRNGDSTPGDVPRPGAAPKGQNVKKINFRVMKHGCHSRKGRYGGRWCAPTPPRRWDDPLSSSVPSDGRARAVSGDGVWGRDRG